MYNQYRSCCHFEFIGLDIVVYFTDHNNKIIILKIIFCSHVSYYSFMESIVTVHLRQLYFSAFIELYLIDLIARVCLGVSGYWMTQILMTF